MWCAMLYAVACCFSGAAVDVHGRARSRQTGDATNPARPSRSLLWSCLVSTCLVPGVTGQQDLALARSSLMTAVAITAVG